jgi:hypothetical protein
VQRRNGTVIISENTGVRYAVVHSEETKRCSNDKGASIWKCTGNKDGALPSMSAATD